MKVVIVYPNLPQVSYFFQHTIILETFITYAHHSCVTCGRFHTGEDAGWILKSQLFVDIFKSGVSVDIF